MNRTYTYIGIVAVLLLIAAGAYAYVHRHAGTNHEAVTATASYLCRDGKSIDASFTDSSAILTLSDTRAFVLPQAVSGSGVRYEKDGVSFVGKGDNAFLEEDGTQTYQDCVATGSPSGAAMQPGYQQFADRSGTFTFSYPDSVSVSGGDLGYTQSWMVNATSSGLALAKATLGKAFQPKTDFSEATFTVGTSPDPSAVAECLTYNPGGGPARAPMQKIINGTTYTVFYSSDAAAGNLYDTTSYRTVRNNQCYAIEYTIHSTQLANYSPDSGVKAYNKGAVMQVMDAMIQSFTFTDGA